LLKPWKPARILFSGKMPMLIKTATHNKSLTNRIASYT
jgi:hypothetical protein